MISRYGRIFQSFCFYSDLKLILATTLDCFHEFKNLVGTIGCSEAFIEKLGTSECNIE